MHVYKHLSCERLRFFNSKDVLEDVWYFHNDDTCCVSLHLRFGRQVSKRNELEKERREEEEKQIKEDGEKRLEQERLRRK